MNTILKGSTAGPIEIRLAPGFDYAGKTVHVNYQGVTRDFPDCVAGGKLELSYGAKETAPMALGVWPIAVWITDEDGTVIRVASTESRIRVTDVPSEVHTSGVIGIEAKGVLAGIEDLPDRYTEADVVAKLREILRAGGAAVRTLLVCAALLGAALLNAATVQTAPKQAIYNDQQIVTNVTFEGLATTNAVKDIVTEVVVSYTEWKIMREGVDVSSRLPQPTWNGDCWVLTETIYGDVGDNCIYDAPEDATYMRLYQSCINPDYDPSKPMEGDNMPEMSIWYTLTRRAHESNALGLARLADLPPLTNGLARTSDIPSTAADIDALPITGGTLRSGKVGKGTELSIIGSYGKYEPEEFIPEGGSVEIKGGDSDQGGEIEIFGGYGNGGNLKIYPPNAGASYGSYGIEIFPEGNGVGNGFIKVNGTNVMDAIAAVDSKVENAVLPTNPAFSNAVLAVGLNIDTNSVAVLNDIAETFGGFPIEGTATTVGGLLAALAAAVAWLKKNKVGSFASVGGASAIVESGVAKLESFFTESNSLLNGRLTYSRNATGLKDRAFNALTFDGTEFNLSTALEAVTPTASGQPRDLLIVATATAATTISFTAGTIKGDKPTIDGSGTWLITLTEYASGVWYCRQIKMEDAA